MKRLTFVVVAGLILAPGPAWANTALIDSFMPKTPVTTEASGDKSATAVDAASESTLEAKPAEQVDRNEVLRKELLLVAKHFRSQFWSGNSCNESYDNWQYFGTSDVIDKIDADIDAADAKEFAKVNADNTLTGAQKQTTFRQRMIPHVARASTKHTLDVEGDERWVGNCVHISHTVYQHLWSLLNRRGASGATLSLQMFSGAPLGTWAGWWNGAHMFVVLECDGYRYIIDGWRGDGEVHGPLLWDAKGKKFKKANKTATLPDYYDRAIDVWVSATVK